MPTSLTAVASYARVSSPRQAQAQTIGSQLAALRERVVQDGGAWNEGLSFVDEGVSGSMLVRPALERLRDAAHAGLFERLYVLAPDRLARKHAHQMVLLEELHGCGVEVVFLNRAIGTSAEDQLLVQVQGIVAEYERAKIQERSRRGKRHAAQQGRVSVFSHAPYGYHYVPAQAGAPAHLEIRPDEADRVVQVFAWVAHERCSLREVCSRLEKQGIPTRTGRVRWEPATIAGMLKNPVYSGYAAYGKTRCTERRPRLRPQRGRPEVPRRPTVGRPRPRDEWITVPVPPLVSADCFAAVAEQLQDNRRRCRVRRTGAGHLLQGLVVCQSCRYACYGQSARSPRRPGVHVHRSYGYYRCIGKDRRRADGQRICHNPTVALAALEDAVWHDVRMLLADPRRVRAEYQRRLAAERQPASSTRQHLSARQQRTQQGITRLIDAFTEGLLEKSEFEPRLRAAKGRLKELQDEVRVFDERDAQEQELQHVVRHLEQFAQQVQDGLEGASWEQRRELIRALIKRVELGPEEVRIVYRVDLHPFDQGPSRGHLRHCVGRPSAALHGKTPMVASRARSPYSEPAIGRDILIVLCAMSLLALVAWGYCMHVYDPAVVEIDAVEFVNEGY